MARLLMVSDELACGASAPGTLTGLDLLPHEVTVVAGDTDALAEALNADLVVLDGRTDLARARTMARLFSSTGGGVPLLLVLTADGLPAVAGEWGLDDIILDTAGAAEFDARIRLLLDACDSNMLISAGGIVIDDAAYSATMDGEPLDLTYTEFELLKYLVQHPGRVFSRDHLLAEVWGGDYYGGSRTVDVHIRRLRAKLGPEHESLIGTVRNVGYRFSPDGGRAREPGVVN